MANISGAKRMLVPQKVRIIAMLVFLVIAAAAVIFAAYNNYPYEGYPYEDYHSYYIDESYIGYVPDYHGYYDEVHHFVSLGDEMVFFGDFEVYDYDNNLMTRGDYLYYICMETMSGYLIGPLSTGIWINFNPNGGITPGGHASRQANEEHASGDYVYIGISNMPNPANSPSEGPNAQREWMAWNTQPDGRGTPFTGDTLICIEYGLGNSTDGAQWHVYAVWGWRINFLGNPILLSALNPGTDPGNSYHFVSRLIPDGWTVNETANYSWIVTSVWPRHLNRISHPIDRVGFDFVGWYDSASVVEGQPIGPDDPITRFTLVFAWWDSHAVPVVTFNPGPFGAISSGLCTIHPGPPLSHSATRNVRVGWNIFDSSTAAPGFSNLNPNVAWSRSAPAAERAGMTVEGWWTEVDGWSGTGQRWASPGGDRTGSGDPTGTFHISTPADWALRTVYDDLTVHAHWVYRVSFHLNLGHVVADSQQPLGFYCHDFPRPNSDHFHGGSSVILFRDIPEGTPLDQRTVALNGMQFNHVTNTGHDRRYIPEGITRDPSGGPDIVPSVIAVARTGHTFNGWWNYQIPPNLVVGGILRTLDPHDPTTLVGTIWQNANLIQFTEDCEIPHSKTVYAHWYPNDEVIVTFDISTQINSAGVRSNYDGAYWPFSWQWPPARNAPIPVGTNLPYQIALAGGATVAGTLQLSMPFIPERPGYIFIGWHTRPHVMSDDLIRGSHFNAGTPVPMNNITVYAQWVPYITVIFDANGGITTAPGPDNPVGGVIWSERIPPGANEERIRLGYGFVRDVTPWGAPYNPATGVPTTPAGSVRVRDVSMGVMRTNGYADAAHGARVHQHLVMATLTARHDRPGFISLLTTWQWIGAGNVGTWRGGSPWNAAQNGTGEIFGENLPTSELMLSPAYDPINKEIRMFMQWGVPIDFIPISTLPLNPDTRRFAVPEGRTIANMFDAPRSRHLPNPDLTFPFVGGPPQAPVIPAAALIQQNNRGVTFSAAASSDMRFPVPNHSVASGLGNWDSVYTHLEVAGLGFRGWFTADGRQFFPDTPLPVLDMTTNDPLTPLPIRIYGHWGNVMTFVAGDHPTPGAVTILPQHQTRPFSPGAISFGDATLFHVDIPPAPSFPTGVGMPSFVGWYSSPVRTDAYAGTRLVHNVTVLVREADFNIYARWGHRIDLNVNAPDANFNHTVAFPAPYTTAEIGDRVHDLAGINDGVEIERANHWRFFGRWNTEPDGSGIFYTAQTPTVTTSRTLYAQWEGQFVFNPNGGTMPGLASNTPQLVYVTEGFTIATNTHVTGPDNPQTVPVVPNHPTHPDPSMVFMGWRIVNSLAADGSILNRTQAANIIMNGYINPNDDDCDLTNAPNGRLELEAVWHQRLIFTKTSEDLYLIHPDTNNANRSNQSPRNGAEFMLERRGAFNTVTGDFDWILIQDDLVSGNAVPALGDNTGNDPFVPALPAQPGRVATRPLTPGAIYRLTETLPPIGYMREGNEGGVWRWIISTEPVVHEVTFRLDGGFVWDGYPNPLPGDPADVIERFPHGATIGAAAPMPHRLGDMFSHWWYGPPINNQRLYPSFMSWHVGVDFVEDYIVTGPVTLTASWLGVGRAGLGDELVSPAMIVPMSGASIDTRITSITPVDHDLYFFDWENQRRGCLPSVLQPQNWHVGNRRPRLNFTKLDRYEEPLDDVYFVVERRVRTDSADPWGEWEVIYTAEPSGSIAIPHLPAQPGPLNTPVPGTVVITRPFTPNTPSQTVEYRLREVDVPDDSGYLIPILGRWNITTNRYSGVEDIIVCTNYNIAPNFQAINPDPNTNPANDWDVEWFVGNIPTRYWPILKTDHYLSTGLHRYLEGAVFRLFVYNGPGTPANTLLPPDVLFPPPGPPGDWSLVAERVSNGGPNGSPPEPMWFPMMPGRHYQLVEVLSPVGFQIPWGQWRIIVNGATSIATIQGTGLTSNVIAGNGGIGTATILPSPNHMTLQNICTPNCPSDCDGTHAISIDAYLIRNWPDFYLPLTGGTGIVNITIAGAVVVGMGLVLLLVVKVRGLKAKGAKAASS